MRRALRFSFCFSLVSLTVGLVGCQLIEDRSDPQAEATPAVQPTAVKQGPKQHKQKHRKPAPLATVAEPQESEAPDEAEPEDETTTASAEAQDDEQACPNDMVLVSGDYCRNVQHTCLEYVMDVEGSPDKDRCKKYSTVVECRDTKPRRKMRYCMDRYEWPNKKGEIPYTLTSWEDAARMCNAVGKRLCTESEFNFACEGEEMRPHATGFERDDKKCNIDKPWHKRRKDMLPRVQCEASPTCKAEMDRLDGREPAGSREECVSPFGVYDMNGNVNEWVSMPWKRPGKRSAVKGGWWGPVRNRCRPIVQSHGETYIGYEVGFRCCSAADEPAKSADASSSDDATNASSDDAASGEAKGAEQRRADEAKKSSSEAKNAGARTAALGPDAIED
ncbi:MAG: SUMF1/EgtB/PvdO family nonheme iron enzyme [Myxococcales bacterium]|nr:SUMF1/EgtB/PvdO family nonheme iron enzyme [Myxococcales bacterium]